MTKHGTKDQLWQQKYQVRCPPPNTVIRVILYFGKKNVSPVLAAVLWTPITDHFEVEVLQSD